MNDSPRIALRFAAEPLEARIAPATFVVINTNDGGYGSLRQALLNANASPDADTIAFAIPGDGIHKIQPGTALPSITYPLTIDGKTQPGYAAAPLIELDGSLIRYAGGYTEIASGITINVSTASQTAVRGLWIHDFEDAQIRISGGASNCQVTGCYLGFGTDFTPGRLEAAGVWVRSGTGNQIGGILPAEANVIGGTDAGILLDTKRSPDTTESTLNQTKVYGNFIGLKPGGLEALPNNYGIRNVHATNTIIGGDNSKVAAGARNYIAANTIAGISFEGEHSTTIAQRCFVQNNYIGTDVTGSKAVGLQGTGILIERASGVSIGGSSSQSWTLANVISGNVGAGITIKDAGIRSVTTNYNNAVVSNFIGTDASGLFQLGNGGDGIRLESTGSTVGTVQIDHNVLAANAKAGLAIIGTESSTPKAGMLVVRNLIGTDILGMKALGNAIGISAEHAGILNLGTTATAANVISGNLGDGIQIDHASSSSAVTISGNLIGTDIKGSRSLPNAGDGIHASGTFGLLTIRGNLLSGNGGDGFYLKSASDTLSLSASSNYVGTNLNHTGVIPNGGFGVNVGGPSSSLTIGGSTPPPAALTSSDAGNIIAGNRSDGVLLLNTSGGKILHNYIGVMRPEQNVANSGNGRNGVTLAVSDSSVIENCLIGGNQGNGIYIVGDSGADENGIISNRIGVDFSGSAGVGNGGHGIAIGGDAQRNFIGLLSIDAPILGNQIGGNGGDGIHVEVGADRNVIKGNTVGGENPAAANGGSGLLVLSSLNQIGGLAESAGNTVLGNSRHGIQVGSTAAENMEQPIISGNVIQNNSVGFTVGEEPLTNRNGDDAIAVFYSAGGLIEGNQIAADFSGIHLKGGDNNMIISNRICMNELAPPEEAGIFIQTASRTQIGTDTPGTGNIVNARLTSLGVYASAGTQVLQNEFSSQLGPAVILAHSNETQLGSSSAPNTIVSGERAGIQIWEGSNNSFNNNFITAQTTGVEIQSGTENSLSQNTIEVGPGGIPIDLGGDGITPNDLLDLDDGANHLQNTPLMRSAALRDGFTLLRGQFDGAPDAEVQIEVYRDNSFLQSFYVRTDLAGRALFGVDVPGEGNFRATATVVGNTSEFSDTITTTAPPIVKAVGSPGGEAPRARLVDVITGNALVNVLAFNRNFPGGVHAATTDVDGDGYSDLVVTSGPGMKPAVKIFSGVDGELISSFVAGHSNDLRARTLAAGDLDGDGLGDVVVGQSSANGSFVAVHRGSADAQEEVFRPFGAGYTGFVQVKLRDFDGDGIAEIVARGRIAGQVVRKIIDLS